jgi:propanediol dehydratase small subunit
MSKTKMDYPLAETQPENIKGLRGKPLTEINLGAVTSGEITMEDLRITPEALRAQAEISRSANRPALALNFERAAELVMVPQDVIMATYELLRPGRANSKLDLLNTAKSMRVEYGAEAIAVYLEEAAEIYEQRGLFKFRY